VSEEVSDNVIAILAHLRDHKEAARKIVARLAGLEPAQRATALEQLFILAGLRRLEETVEREARKMPIHIDILENQVLGREFKRGEVTVLRRQIEKRFGTLPDWVEERLATASTSQLDQWTLRILDAASLEDLLR
jgi:hypothetical protein